VSDGKASRLLGGPDLNVGQRLSQAASKEIISRQLVSHRIDSFSGNKVKKNVLAFGLVAFCATSLAAMMYVLFDGPLVKVVLAEPLYLYTLLLSLASVGLAWLIVLKTGSLGPSVFLYLFFVCYAVFGPLGVKVYRSLYGLYLGRYTITPEFPLFVWAVGTVSLLVGVLLAHSIVRRATSRYVRLWRSKPASFFFWFIIGIALVSTVYALIRIGYVPILRGNIDVERGNYSEVVGYPIKFSRFWLFGICMSSMFVFLRKNKTLFIVITIVSLLALTIYGQRFYIFIGLSCFILLYYKFHRFKLHQFAYGVLLIVGLLYFAEYRSSRALERLSVSDMVTMNVASVWQEYAVVVNQVRATQQFYEWDIFIGAMVPVLPKEVWAVFGVDKEYLIRNRGAAYVFGRQFHDPLGIRVGTIGEAYAGFGLIPGVCLQMLLFGLILGVLEIAYLRLDKTDGRLALVCLLISIIMMLPFTTLYVTIAAAGFFGSFLFLICEFGTIRTEVSSDERGV